jgi:hypothetical protein
LKVRPIFHRLADRVRAHLLVCMLAYYVEWHLRRALAPLLFDDADKEGTAAKRRSVVQKGSTLSFCCVSRNLRPLSRGTSG